MAKMLLCLFFCISALLANSQNLVGNKGFEERNICTEYQVQCAPEAWFFLPRYARMSPVERDSNNYELIAMGDPRKDFSVGNFIYTKLFCPLQPQQQYRLSFRIKIPTFSFDYLDVWFSAGEPGSRGNSLYGRKTLHTINPENVFLLDKRSWMEVNYVFTAKGGERFLTMGNFQQKPLIKAKRSSRKKRVVEYWIDDIQLLPVDTTVKVCVEYEALKDQVYRNNPRHPGRFIDNIPIDSSLLAKQPKKDTVVVDTPIVVTRPDTPVIKTDTLIIPDVLFHFNSSKLNPAFAPRLDSLGRKIINIRFSKLVIAGHTDNVGTDEYNFTLSSERATTIMNYLVENFSLNKTLIETLGYGESLPRASNNTAAGRQQNRRVEIIIFYQ